MFYDKKHFYFLTVVLIFIISVSLYSINKDISEPITAPQQGNVQISLKTSAKTETENLETLEQDIQEKDEQFSAFKQKLKIAEKEIAQIDESIKILEKEKHEEASTNITNLVSWYDIVGLYKAYQAKTENIEFIEKQISEETKNKEKLQKNITQIIDKKNKIEKDLEDMKERYETLKKINPEANDLEIIKEIENKTLNLISEKEDFSITEIGNGFQLPDFIMPAVGEITSQFGYRIHPISGEQKYHSGTDIGVNYGDDIVASNYGKVIWASWYGGFGNTVILSHGAGIYTLYGHNSDIIVNKGDIVQQGDVIAKGGSTGYSTGPHCHFSMWVNRELVNPLDYVR